VKRLVNGGRDWAGRTASARRRPNPVRVTRCSRTGGNLLPGVVEGSGYVQPPSPLAANPWPDASIVGWTRCGKEVKNRARILRYAVARRSVTARALSARGETLEKTDQPSAWARRLQSASFCFYRAGYRSDCVT
jgi:hypothetical protein